MSRRLSADLKKSVLTCQYLGFNSPAVGANEVVLLIVTGYWASAFN
jgi:hypothetical protein